MYRILIIIRCVQLRLKLMKKNSNLQSSHCEKIAVYREEEFFRAVPQGNFEVGRVLECSILWLEFKELFYEKKYKSRFSNSLFGCITM